MFLLRGAFTGSMLMTSFPLASVVNLNSTSAQDCRVPSSASPLPSQVLQALVLCRHGVLSLACVCSALCFQRLEGDLGLLQSLGHVRDWESQILADGVLQLANLQR